MLPGIHELKTLRLQNGFSVEALVQSALEEATTQKHLNAFVSLRPEAALKDAREVKQKLESGQNLPLAGLVLAVKDNIAVAGEKLTCASGTLKDFRTLYESTVVSRLRNAGAVVIGKTNLDEFGMGSSSENTIFGPVHNPKDTERVPGGSSGGSAAAVAAGICQVALGSDTGGSVRQPASFCGVVGLKPTYGRLSRYGLVAYASSLDTIGIIGQSVPDVAAILEVAAGVDDMDSTSSPEPVPPYLESLEHPVKGLKIGIPKEYLGEGLDSGIRQIFDDACHKLESLGVMVQEVSLPHTEYAIAAYYIIATAEASSNLARYDGARYGTRTIDSVGMDSHNLPLSEMVTQSRTSGFGTEVKRRIMLGTYVLSAGYYDAYYKKAQRVRRLIQDDFIQVFKQVDAVLTPTSPTVAFRIGEKMADPLEMYLSDVYTVTANLAGIPALVFPAGFISHLPVGLQLMGPHFSEEKLLQIANTVSLRA
jgi:aspartyl-tRNA(Asn)/glutamyl-tRNA(Gln) amidotransferase subunit A